MKYIVKYLLLFILISSCTKFGKNVTINGKVLNPITGEAIPNAEIWLQKTTSGLPGGLKTIKKATSDSNGVYELNKFSFRASSAICVLGSDYYKIGWKDASTGENMGNPTLNVKKGITMDVNFYAVLYGENLTVDKNEMNFNVYPNPNNGTFTVFLDNNLEGKLYISTLQGQLLGEMNVENGTVIKLESINNLKGVVLLKFIGSNHIQLNSKMLLE